MLTQGTYELPILFQLGQPLDQVSGAQHCVVSRFPKFAAFKRAEFEDVSGLAVGVHERGLTRISIMSNHTQLAGVKVSYDEAAEILDCSPRYVRDLLKLFPGVCEPDRAGHRSVKLPLDGVFALVKARREAALAAATRQPRLAPRGKVKR